MTTELKREISIMLSNPAWGCFKEFCSGKSNSLFEQAVGIDTINELMRQQQLLGAAGEIKALCEAFENSVYVNNQSLNTYE